MGDIISIDYRQTLQHRNLQREGHNMCTKLKKMSTKTPEQILVECDMLNRIPVDVRAICKHYGIECISTDFSTVNKNDRRIYGAILSEDDELSIFVEKNDSEEIQRFTIAHELAHCCIDTERVTNLHYECRDEFTKHDKIEEQMNAWAAELLMPAILLRKIFVQLPSQPDLEALADAFKVPSKSMKKRLQTLQLGSY